MAQAVHVPVGLSGLPGIPYVCGTRGNRARHGSAGRRCYSQPIRETIRTAKAMTRAAYTNATAPADQKLTVWMGFRNGPVFVEIERNTKTANQPTTSKTNSLNNPSQIAGSSEDSTTRC